MLGFGPDILHLVDDAVLKNVGFTPGDVIRLKQNSQQWWNSKDAKRKRANETPSVQSTPPNKRVAFEKRYHDGGCYRVYGPRMVEDDEFTPATDIDWYYFCKARDAWVPLPLGHAPVLDGDE
jgi:hypothetical protein